MSRDLAQLFVEEAGRHVEAARRALPAAACGDADALYEAYRALHSVKGMAASLGLDAIVAAAHDAEEQLDRTRRGERPPETLGSLVPPRLDEVSLGLEEFATRPRQSARPRSESEEPALALRLPPVRIEALRFERLLELATSLRASFQRVEHELPAPDDPRELGVRDALARAVRALSRELFELHLVPLSGLVPVLRSALTRWAAERGVRVRLEVEGEEMRLDRALVERLFDPLGHLLRNALVHGIEGAEERRRAGKDEEGLIRLVVRPTLGRIGVRVEDDGRGLDPQAVLRRAQRAGVVSEERARSLSESEALALLEHPALAARARAADALAGRGMGLAAARRAAEELGGELRLRATRGRGFVATLLVPARTRVVEVFLAHVGGKRFALAAAAALEVRAAGEIEIAPLGALPEGPDDARVFARLDLAEHLRLEQRGPARSALVVEEGGRRVALLVERIDARREVVVRPLGPPLERLAPYAGAAFLAEGGLALVLDPLELARAASAMRLAEEAPLPARSPGV